MYYNNLKTSSKHIPHNVIILHLLPNHITAIPQTPTIHLPQFFSIHKYHTLFQITTTLSPPLQHHIQFIHIIPPLFPSPSITAPPKINT
ncbi:chorismate-binding protein, partial [Staphylococcus epidermidis]|uniref:chorismate-binding protein n=1 Tax=Staphylococcus epidermidis TaxID=1282 RepID=UPI0037DA3851